MNWEDYIDDPALISSLKSNNMHEPTDVQKASLTNSCKYRQDLIISSKTGSGKTLCFAIPILLFTEKSSCLQCLIISPTRELCLQISAHIAAINYKSLNILTLIGGMSHEKQERLIKRKPEIVIGTPGRLWEYVKDRQNDYIRSMVDIKFLVIDEADRMIQMGHFKELRLILNYIYNPSSMPKEVPVSETHGNVVDLNFAYEESIGQKDQKIKIQTFVISATMTIDKSSRKSFSGKLGKFKDSGEDIMEKLDKTIKFRAKPKLIDLTSSCKLPEGLKEYIVLCRDEEKSGILHYLLKKFAGMKAIIFTNTISASRKLVSFLRYLDFDISKLDGKMQQRDRLKKLEKFVQSNSILIATDVAARGLDLPEVGLIIHYNLPHNVENYIHRSGRTARIYKSGTSIALIAPSDTKNLGELEKYLGKKIEKFKIDAEELRNSSDVVELALEISEKEALTVKTSKNFAWEARFSDSIGVGAEEDQPKAGKKQIKHMKKQLELIKHDVTVPKKRGSVITPELYALAKHQKLI